MGEDDADARFARFVAESGPRIVSFATLLTRDQSYAEDVVQDCLMRAYLRWRRAGAPEHPDAYLRRAVVNAVVSRSRRKRIEPSRLVQPHAGPLPLDTVYAERDAMWSALGELSPRQRAVLVLRFYEGLDDADIATVLDCARGTVRSLASRALVQLRTHPGLAGRFDDEPTGGHDPSTVDQNAGSTT